MSNIPRRSSTNPQTGLMRRSTSADVKWANSNSVINSLSQGNASSASANNNRQSLIDRGSISNYSGRASSIGGRASLMGRSSISGAKAGEAKPINTYELAQSIISVKTSLS